MSLIVPPTTVLPVLPAPPQRNRATMIVCMLVPTATGIMNLFFPSERFSEDSETRAYGRPKEQRRNIQLVSPVHFGLQVTC